MERKPYRPSNGTEGMNFMEEYCMNCINCDPNPDGKKQCQILCASLVYDVDEDGYPKEWIYNDKGEPCCTEYKKWDWEKDGDPDDPDNPNAPTPFNPNQLTIF